MVVKIKKQNKQKLLRSNLTWWKNKVFIKKMKLGR